MPDNPLNKEGKYVAIRNGAVPFTVSVVNKYNVNEVYLNLKMFEINEQFQIAKGIPEFTGRFDNEDDVFADYQPLLEFIESDQFKTERKNLCLMVVEHVYKEAQNLIVAELEKEILCKKNIK